MLNHLMHVSESSWPAQAQLLDLVNHQELQRALTPPHSTSARGDDNSYHHYHDLVVISIGTGG